VGCLSAISERPVMAVVKANAYGHGLVEVARAALEGGASWCGVARFEEALTLRDAGLECPILVMGYVPPVCVPQAISCQISLALYDRDLGEDYGERARSAGGRLRVHLKVDTGMGRLGVSPADSLDFTRWAWRNQDLEVEGLFTHFARSDEPDAPSNPSQRTAFQNVLHAIETEGLRPRWVHAANSAAALYMPDVRYDLVRCGIALYGLDPSYPECVLPGGFKPALTWKATLASVKNLPAAHGVGYGHLYVTSREEKIGVLPVGYADGYRRMVPNEVLIGGMRLPVIKRICMDQSMLVLDGLSSARVGDEVVLIGCQGDQKIRAEDLAASWNTNNYDVVCGLAARLPRVYKNSIRTHKE